MSWHGPEFVIAIILISTGGWLISSWIRARHGYPIENEWSGRSERSDVTRDSRIASLSRENDALRAELDAIADRLATLERIVTDPTHRLTHDIESLRGSAN